VSTEALQQALDELQALPDMDQKLVLDYLKSLRERRERPIRTAVRIRNPNVVEEDGMLVFLGEIADPHVDWVRREREEREEELVKRVTRDFR
jgi:hypothetical protein